MKLCMNNLSPHPCDDYIPYFLHYFGHDPNKKKIDYYTSYFLLIHHSLYFNHMPINNLSIFLEIIFFLIINDIDNS